MGIYIYFIFIVLLLGAAYVIWILADKETDTKKTIGNVLAALIVIIAVILLFYGGYGGMMGHGGTMRPL